MVHEQINIVHVSTGRGWTGAKSFGAFGTSVDGASDQILLMSVK